MRMRMILGATTTLVCLSGSVAYADYSKDYCGKKEFLGNDGNKSPHLHCGKDFISYKKYQGNNFNILPNNKGVVCTRVNTARQSLADDGPERISDQGRADIEGVLNALAVDNDCH